MPFYTFDMYSFSTYRMRRQEAKYIYILFDARLLTVSLQDVDFGYFP